MGSCDHDIGGIAKLIPSVSHFMNQSTNPGDSLYSGGPGGTGFTTVAVHDATLDPSSGMKHAAHFHTFLKYLAYENGSGDETN